MPGSTGERLLHGAGRPVVIVPKDYRTSTHVLDTVGVAYDGSAESAVALRAAAGVARATGARLRVIRVLEALAYGTPAMMGGPSYTQLSQDVEANAREELDAAVADLPPDVDAAAVFLSGDPARELAEQTRTLDLLVTGSRGYGPLRAVMTGGVTGRLMRDAACPVVILPRGVESPLGALFAGTSTGSYS